MNGAAHRRDRTWTLLALLLAACGGSMAVSFAARDTTHTMEQVALVTSQEAWLRWHEGDASALLVTSNDFMPRLRKPPMLTWLTIIAWSDLDPFTASRSLMVTRARMVSLALGLVLLASVFWMGSSLGGRRLAVLSMLVAGSILLLQRQARTASYDIHVVAWSALAAAAALWAMQPGRPAPTRGARVLGWGLSGVSLGMAVLSKNPLPILLVATPVITVLALVPGRRAGSVLGLLAAVGLATLVAAPWYVYVLVEFHATEALQVEFAQHRGTDAQPFYYYLAFFALAGPWAIWLGSGLVHPFMRYVRDHRRRLLVAWTWFVTLFVLFSIPDAKQQRYILAIVPAAALLIAQVWLDHDGLAPDSTGARSARGLVRVHWASLLLVSLGIGFALAQPDRFFTWLNATRSWFLEHAGRSGLLRDILVDDWPEHPALGTVPTGVALGAGVVLAALSVTGFLWHRRGHAYRAGLVTAAWSLIALAIQWYGYARAPSAVHPLRADTEAFRARVGATPLRTLRLSEQENWHGRLNEEFRFYYGRLIRHVRPETLERFLETPGTIYVLAKETDEHAAVMRDAGFVDEGRVQTDRDRHYRLWERRVAAD